MKLNQSIKYYRTEAGMSQAELAEKTYTTKSSVSKWESGSITPNIDMIKIIAKALDIKFYQLIGEKEPLGRKVVNIIGKVFLYLFAWIHIDITLGVTVSAMAAALGLAGTVSGVGGSIALTVMYSINHVWTPILVGYVVVILLATPFLFALFESMAYALFTVAKYIYHLSLKYFWGVTNNLDKLAIKPNKKLIKWGLIVAGISGLILIIFLAVVIPSNGGDWSILSPQF